MIGQLGPPTFFPLLEALRQFNENMARVENESILDYEWHLIRLDLVMTAWYFVHKLKAMKNLLCSKSNILGRSLQDYFFVTKFHGHGSQHDHGFGLDRESPYILAQPRWGHCEIHWWEYINRPRTIVVALEGCANTPSSKDSQKGKQGMSLFIPTTSNALHGHIAFS